MKFERDPRDRRYPERLAGSFLASLIFHALLAALLFTVLVSSSQQGATESVQGGEVVTIARTSTVTVPNQRAAVRAAPVVPHVHAIAPLLHAPLAQPLTQRLPVNRHELAKTAPTAPPNPRPIPQQSPQPNPQPTQNIFETQARNELPAAPVSVPTVAPVAVAIKTPSTVAPSPVPSSVPSAHPSPAPPAVVKPAAKVASPAPAQPKVVPTAAAAARASAVPSTAPAARASAPPAQRAGVPNPRPTSTTAVSRAAGTAPSPGPSGGASPGPRTGAGPKPQAAPERPIAIPPAPPSPRPTGTPKTENPRNLNAKLRALLPNNPVHPTTKSYGLNYSLRGRLEPTPPPDVLARTRYIYEVRNTGGEARVKMWVTAAHKAGPTTICTGWLVRYPQAIRGGYADAAGPDPSIVHGDLHGGPANGTQISIGGGGGVSHEPLSPFAAGLAPIVDGMVSQPCNGRLLVPYAPSPGSSP